MPSRRDMPVAYSRAEQVSDAVVHVAGVLAALVAVPVLVTVAAVRIGDLSTVLAALVYGLSLLAMIVCSALYNMTQQPEWRAFLRRLDHSAIYVKIAGTYTPFAVLAGGHAGPLLAGLWGAALAGISLRVLAPDRFWAAIALYLAMGWAGVLLGGEMIERLSPQAFSLMLAGGLIYTGGIVFFLWERLPFHNTIWHVFVLVASLVFYAAVLIELSNVPDLAPAGGDALSLLRHGHRPA